MRENRERERETEKEGEGGVGGEREIRKMNCEEETVGERVDENNGKYPS